jgi:hypothetical protein
MIANGFVPVSVSSTGTGVNLVPSEGWPKNCGIEGVYALKYIGDIDLKCVQVGPDRLMIHASDGKDLYSSELSLPIESTLPIKNHIVRPLLAKEFAPHQRPPVEEHQRRIFQTGPSEPSSPPPGRGGFQPPRAPPFGQPIGPGELVGPNHPLFTGEGQTHERPGGVRDPRFDPFGPGYIGEPDTDHFPPPPFGQPPGRAPLRGPRSNVGPGGMFM